MSLERQNQVKSLLKPLSDNPRQIILSEVLQQSDILESVCEQMEGPISVVQTSYSVADEYLRRLMILKERYDIKYIEIVLDLKATSKTLKIIALLHQVADRVHLTKNHSKVTLISNGKQNISVITSQNLTRGNRYELNIISSDNEVYSILDKQVKGMIGRGTFTLKELVDEKAYLTKYTKKIESKNGKVNSPQHSKEDNG